MAEVVNNGKEIRSSRDKDKNDMFNVQCAFRISEKEDEYLPKENRAKFLRQLIDAAMDNIETSSQTTAKNVYIKELEAGYADLFKLFIAVNQTIQSMKTELGNNAVIMQLSRRYTAFQKIINLKLLDKLKLQVLGSDNQKILSEVKKAMENV